MDRQPGLSRLGCSRQHAVYLPKKKIDDRFFCADETFDLSSINLDVVKQTRVQRGRTTGAVRTATNGRRIGSRPRQPGDQLTPLDFGKTLNASIVRRTRTAGSSQGPELVKEDLHLQVRNRQTRRLVVFVIDTSDSMGDGPTARITAAMGACIAIAATAYLHRDQVCLVTFRDREARLVVPPTTSVMRIRQQLQRLPVGGATPLAAGLEKARQVIGQARLKNRQVEPLLVLISDGEATMPLTTGGDPDTEAMAAARLLRRDRIAALVIDTQASRHSQSLMSRLARVLGTDCRHIHDLHAGQVLQLIDKSGSAPSR